MIFLLCTLKKTWYISGRELFVNANEPESYKISLSRQDFLEAVEKLHLDVSGENSSIVFGIADAQGLSSKYVQ